MVASHRRHFGTVRKRASGRWQASYWHLGKRHNAPHTFAAKTEALAWLSGVETDIKRAAWIDPVGGRTSLSSYAETWLERRPDLRPSTRARYRDLLERNILPEIGNADMATLQPSSVRAWWAKLAATTPSTAAGAYRLLAAIFNTAVADNLIVRSPFQVKRTGAERAAERPSASVTEASAAIEAVPSQYRLALLLAARCQLRRSEILGLQHRDVDELHGALKVRRGLVVHVDGTKSLGTPKTEAGVRTVAIPANVLPALKNHLSQRVGRDPGAWLFPGQKAQPITPRTLDRIWERARAATGRPDLHLHDLRHSGLTWSTATGATTAELMHRAGHKSPAAALRYQHATEDRDRALADALAGLASAQITPIKKLRRGPSRQQRAQIPR